MRMTITMTAGNDTEGAVLEHPLVDVLFPNMSDSQVVSTTRDQLMILIQLIHQLRTGQSAADSQAFVQANSFDTH